LLGLLFRTRNDHIVKSNLILVMTPHIIRDSNDMRRIFQRKMDERQELMDHESIFTNVKWTPPKDYARTRGLLDEIRLTRLAVEQKKRDDAAAAPRGETGQIAQPPLEMPVPQSPAGGAKPATAPAAPGGGVAVPAKPTVIER
jgi:general secretion pathway protein D